MTVSNVPAASRSPRAAVWWLHPLLVAAFPVLFLFAANVREFNAAFEADLPILPDRN